LKRIEVRRNAVVSLVDHHGNWPNEKDIGMARRSPPRKVTYFEPVPPRLPHNIIIEQSIFDIGCRFRRTMRVDCGFGRDTLGLGDYEGAIRESEGLLRLSIDRWAIGRRGTLRKFMPCSRKADTFRGPITMPARYP
jgi:hypothetical protein